MPVCKANYGPADAVTCADVRVLFFFFHMQNYSIYLMNLLNIVTYTKTATDTFKQNRTSPVPTSLTQMKLEQRKEV